MPDFPRKLYAIIGCCAFFPVANAVEGERIPEIKIALPGWEGGQLIAYNSGAAIASQTSEKARYVPLSEGRRFIH